MYQYDRLLTQKIHMSIFPVPLAVNWGPKKPCYPYKGARNVLILHSCEQMSQMPTLQGDTLRNDSCRTMEEEIKHLWISFTNKHTYCCDNLGQITINQESGWRSTSVLMVIRHPVTAGAVSPLCEVRVTQPHRSGTSCWVFVASPQMQLALMNQNYARKLIYMLSRLKHSLLLLPSHLSQAKHAW